MVNLRTKLFEWLAPLVVLSLLVLAWHLAVAWSGISEIVVPSPKSVYAALGEMKGKLWQATIRTSTAAAVGLACSAAIGVSVAFLFSQSNLIRRTFYPYAILLQTVPIVAVAPIILNLFDRGLIGIALVAMILGLFPIITSTTTGLLQVDRSLVELFQLHSATRWQVFWKLQLPGALPYVLSGIRIAGGAAIVGAIVGEFFVGSSQPGLGAMIQSKASGIDTDELYATVAVATSLGIATFGAITLAGELLLNKWFGMSLSNTGRKDTSN